MFKIHNKGLFICLSSFCIIFYQPYNNNNNNNITGHPQNQEENGIQYRDNVSIKNGFRHEKKAHVIWAWLYDAFKEKESSRSEKNINNNNNNKTQTSIEIKILIYHQSIDQYLYLPSSRLESMKEGIYWVWRSIDVNFPKILSLWQPQRDYI